MSALLDSLAGGYTGDSEDDGVGDSSGSYVVQTPGGGVGTNYAAGAFQSLMTLGTGYLARSLDIDLQKRAQGAQPMPMLRTTQNGLGGYAQVVKTPGGSVATLNLSAITPLLMVAAVVFFLARR